MRNFKQKFTNKFFLLGCFVLISFFTEAQSYGKQFKKLSSPEKCWVIFHPFKAKKAFIVSKKVQQISDSIQKTNLLDKDGNGGQVDAFRHAFWMASLAKKIGKRSAKSLGKAHEKGNYKQFKKKQFEEGTVPDAIASEMDLFNNLVGLVVYEQNKKVPEKTVMDCVIEKIKNAELKIIKKDSLGNFLRCDGTIISAIELLGKWENEKCLIPSGK